MRHSLVLFSTAASLAMAAPTRLGVTGPRPYNKEFASHAVAARALAHTDDCLSILRNADPKLLRELYKQSKFTSRAKQDHEVCQKLVSRMTPRASHHDDEDDEDDETCENPTATTSPAPTATSGGDDDDDCDAPDPTQTPDPDSDCDDDDSDAGSDSGDDDCSDDGSDDGDDDDCSDSGSEGGDDSDDESDCDDDEPSPTGSESAPTSTPTGGGSGGSCSKKYTVKSGDTCSKVAEKYGITLSDFYTWNPDIDSECMNLEIDKSYCVD